MTLFAIRFGLPVGDDKQIVSINTIAALASFVVVTLAGVVAIIAYRLASGTPSLEVEVRFPFLQPNAPEFGVEPDTDSAEQRTLLNFKQLDGTVIVHNRNRYAARNPGVRIHFHGLANLRDQEGWETTSFMTTLGVTEIQWDGGADLMIHGRWS